MRTLTSASFLLRFASAVIAAAVLIVLIDSSERPHSALASHTGGADNFLIDMDPTGNTATSVGSVQTCARVNPNGVKDADEDVIDGVGIDIMVGPLGIPASNPMIAFTYDLLYPPPLVVSAASHSFLLANTPGSTTIEPGDTTPDADGTYVGQAYDFSDWGIVPPESGEGTLSRLTISAPLSASTGVRQIQMRFGVHIDTQGEGRLPHNSSAASVPLGAHLAVGLPCPAAVDIVATTNTVSVPSSTPVGAPFNVTVDAAFVNSGGLSLTTKAFVYLDLPLQCTTSSTKERHFTLTLSPGTPVSPPSQVFEVYCFNVGSRDIRARASVGLDDTNAVEGDPLNNTSLSAVGAVTVTPVPVAPVDYVSMTDRIYISSAGNIQTFDPTSREIDSVFQRPGSQPSNVQVDLDRGRIYWSTWVGCGT
jgi:hypothetical protein